MTSPIYRKKLIEVALPLEAINRESAREKSIRHGHPSTLHLWWARRPLAACRAVLFASLVDDPSSRPEEFPTEEAQNRERQRLFRLIEDLVKWDNSTNESVLNAARTEILRSTNGNPPPVLDPFCGGGSIPVEAQRLGLEAHGSDLNPIPVLITKALIEIPPKFAGRQPANPEARQSFTRSGTWKGAGGIANDIRYYSRWMRNEAERRIGHLYPKVRLDAQYGGGEATIIAWLWARTVPCPNPACGARMPLVRSFALAAKKGREAWLEPAVDRLQQPPSIRFEVRTGTPDAQTRARNELGTSAYNPKGKKLKATFLCAACQSGVAGGAYIDEQASRGEMRVQLLALVAEDSRGRLYHSATEQHSSMALETAPAFLEDSGLRTLVPTEPCRGTFASNAQGRIYGFRTFGDYFTARQLVALTTFSSLVSEARERVLADALAAGFSSDSTPLRSGGTGSVAYADAVATYLAFGVDKLSLTNTTQATWQSNPDRLTQAYSRQAIPMTWDFAEANPLSDAGGGYSLTAEAVGKVLERLPLPALEGVVVQRDAREAVLPANAIVSTDPPYYDNIGYADLSDYFYVWLRASLRGVYPDLFDTLLVPKAEELIASPYRFAGDKAAADAFFEDGFARVFSRLREQSNPEFPLTVFYAFKQSESSDEDEDGTASEFIASTGWETMLSGMIGAGFVIDGTWPMRTELVANLKKTVGALASSIVLVCRPRNSDAPSATRRQFLGELHRELPSALRSLQHGNIAPVDLAQAAIGPGMAVFSRYSRVLESDGSPMRVRTALGLINQVLAETVAEQEGAMDGDTRWALTWFDQYGFAEGPFGDADILAKAKVTSTLGLVEAGIVQSARGKVRLLNRSELRSDWDPKTDNRRTVWEATHYLIRTLEENGEQSAATLLSQLGEDSERARDLAYRLYTTCERRGWAQDAQAYNSLVVAWPELSRLAASVTIKTTPDSPQPSLGF